MNKPISPPQADPDIGPLDEDGQQIWSPEEEAAIARLHGDTAYARAIEGAIADADAGNIISHDEHLASMAEMKRRWFADRAR